MAYELPVSQQSVSLVAGADLSSLQYTFVKLNSSGQVVAVAAATDLPIGVLQNAPTSGKTAEVAVHGVTKLKASAAIATPKLVGTTSTGTAVGLVAGTDTTKFILGQAVTSAGASGDIITVAISCIAPARGA
jgi:hypothetical protein